MARLVEYMDRKFYPHMNTNWDDAIFRQYILEKACPEFVCLDYGAGRGNVKLMNFRHVVKKVCGVDVDSAVFSNPHLDEARLIDSPDNKIAYGDNTFDLVFSDNVLEHVEDPSAVMTEIFRVLKPGGYFLAKTPNKLHYMPLFARLTPTWFHGIYNKWRGRDEVDTFPTFYRINTEREVKSFAKKINFELIDLQLIEGRPEYLRLSAVTYFFGYLYERLVNRFRCLSRYRVVLLFVLRKAEVAGT